jgi:hypothetical protein
MALRRLFVYFYSINDELKRMKKKFTIQKSNKTNWNSADILLEYLKQSKGHLQTKERHPFVGGKNTHSSYRKPIQKLNQCNFNI